MIEKSSFEKALNVADIYAAKGLTVVPVEGTPLAQLVSSTNLIGDLPPALNGGEFVAEDAASLSFASDNDTHSSFYDDYVNVLSKSLAFQIGNARNIVNPIINEAVSSIKSIMGAANASTYSFDLIQVDLPAPLQNISLVEEISKNSNGSLLAPRGRIILRGKTEIESVIASMVTGSELFDVAIREWVDSKGTEAIMNIWRKTFAPVSEGDLQTVPELLDVLRGAEVLDTALVVYLTARKLLDDVPEDSGMTLASWKEAVRDYITDSAMVINRELTINEARNSNKGLVISVNHGKKVVTVNGKVYRDYISTGGKNEIIFGAIVLNEVPFTVQPLIENAEKYIKSWDSYASINKASLKLKTFSTFKETCEYVLISQLETLAEFEEEKMSQQANFKQVVASSYSQQINQLLITDMEDVYGTVMKLVTLGRFPYTDSYRFLNSMNEAARENPSIDPREAATVATCEYIADHFSDQMKLV